MDFSSRASAIQNSGAVKHMEKPKNACTQYPAAALPAGLGDLSTLEHSLQPVETGPASDHEMAALMYDAHETLARVDPKNLQRFKDVLAFLREDLKRF